MGLGQRLGGRAGALGTPHGLRLRDRNAGLKMLAAEGLGKARNIRGDQVDAFIARYDEQRDLGMVDAQPQRQFGAGSENSHAGPLRWTPQWRIQGPFST